MKTWLAGLLPGALVVMGVGASQAGCGARTALLEAGEAGGGAGGEAGVGDGGSSGSGGQAGAPLQEAGLAPRPIAPLSTATVTSQSPRLRWQLGQGDDGVILDLCLDRACTKFVASIAASGSSYLVSTPGLLALDPGVYFWRLTGFAGGKSTGHVSPTWQFRVPHRTTPVQSSWGTTPDLDGDGRDDVLVMAPGLASAWGRLDVFLNSPQGLAPQASASLLSHSAGLGPGDLGEGVVTSAGDVNGDGYADILVGLPRVKQGVGQARIFLMGPGGPLATDPIVLAGPAVNGAFGTAVASAGDVDGDGYADILVGAPNESTKGRGYLFPGGPLGPGARPPVVIEAPSNDAGFGAAVAGAGDLNGDGFGDVVVSNWQGAIFSGIAQVFLGGPAGLSLTPTTLTGTPYSAFGLSVAGAGDINGDGFADLIVGAPHVGNAEGDKTGAIHLFLGGPSGISPGAGILLKDPGTVRLGTVIAGAGDINGDGLDDIVTGEAVGVDGKPPARLFLGNASGSALAVSAFGVLSGPDQAGFPVAGLGDVNGDGFLDIALALPGQNKGAGQVQIFLGGPTGLAAKPALTIDGTSSDNLGSSLAWLLRGGRPRGRG